MIAFLVFSGTNLRPQRLTNAAAAPELEARLTGTSVAADGVDAQLVARMGLLALVHVWATHVERFSHELPPQRRTSGVRRPTRAAQAIGRPAEAPPTAQHTSVRANGVHAVLAVVARPPVQRALVDV